MQLTSQEISYYRDQLSDCEPAMKSLDIIEDAEGDLEDAATSIALAIGQTPDRVDWLDGWAKRCRVAICEVSFRSDLEDNYIENAVKYLLEKKICPPLLITPLLIYVVKNGIEQFCEPLSYKLGNDNETL
ncbi:hypothetical protein [Cyanobacterium sp. Dongsha4]|uniref:hypothetical protein n=1 Tax=Cyanobacterium sp. DS4 TaxID=2878255 RepID=UPI002E8021A7|nr:hypothetical protein [Cyanobacterium sp. Dongsha4]WVK99802.1 hypothetical protein Dongsha4_14155 [Cyanobacterium sp. Dongsha4]